MPLIDVLVEHHGIAGRTAAPLIVWGGRLGARTEREGVEFAVTFDADSGARLRGVLRGDGRGVEVEPHLRAMRPGRRYVALHTHPASSSFSDADAATFLVHAGLGAMLAIGVDGTWYILSKPPRVVPVAPEDAVRRFHEVLARLVPWYRAQVQAGRLGQREAWRAHSHEAWQTVAPELGLRYSRVELTGRE